MGSAFQVLQRLADFMHGKHAVHHRPQLVEEVLNDTLLVVWNKPESYNGASRLSTWIFASIVRINR